jgi:hypothetical protein
LVKKVIDSIRSKISKSLKGRIQSETEKINQILGAQKTKQLKLKTKTAKAKKSLLF